MESVLKMIPIVLDFESVFVSFPSTTVLFKFLMIGNAVDKFESIDLFWDEYGELDVKLSVGKLFLPVIKLIDRAELLIERSPTVLLLVVVYVAFPGIPVSLAFCGTGNDVEVNDQIELISIEYGDLSVKISFANFFPGVVIYADCVESVVKRTTVAFLPESEYVPFTDDPVILTFHGTGTTVEVSVGID